MLGNPIDWNCASCEKSKINFNRGRLCLAAKHTALHLTSIKAQLTLKGFSRTKEEFSFSLTTSQPSPSKRKVSIKAAIDHFYSGGKGEAHKAHG
jgi:hypothetical protein